MWQCCRPKVVIAKERSDCGNLFLAGKLTFEIATPRYARFAMTPFAMSACDLIVMTKNTSRSQRFSALSASRMNRSRCGLLRGQALSSCAVRQSQSQDTGERSMTGRHTH